MNLQITPYRGEPAPVRAQLFCDGHLLLHLCRSGLADDLEQFGAACYPDGSAVQIYAWLAQGMWLQRWTGTECFQKAVAGAFADCIGVIGGSAVAHRHIEEAAACDVSAVEVPYVNEWTSAHVEQSLAALKAQSKDGQLPKHIFVGLGAPKQEKWIALALRLAPHDVKFYGVGAAIDYLGGAKKRAPSTVRRLHLEWLFRIFQEPRRLVGRYAWVGLGLLPLYLSVLVTSRKPCRDVPKRV